MMCCTECPTLGDGRSGSEVGRAGGGALGGGETWVRCIPPRRRTLCMSVGDLDMYLRGVRGG